MRTILMLLTGMFALAACNTIEGAGEDIEETGDAIEDSTD